MEKSKENLLPKIKTETFLAKILNKIRNLFKSNKTEEPLKKEFNTKNNEFINSLKPEDVRILELQQRYETGTLEDYQMTDEQILTLERLYRKQIVEIKENINNYKNKIIIERKKIGILN